MNVRKTWFSYIEWVLFSCALLFLFYLSWNSFFEAMAGANIVAASFMTASVFIVLLLIFILLYYKPGTVYIKLNSHKTAAKTVSVLVFLLLLAVFVGIRIPSAQQYDKILESSYFSAALILPGKTAPLWSFASLADIYISLLSFLLRFLGNKPAAAVILQIALQTGGFLLLYFAMRNLAGNLTGIISVIFYTFIPAGIGNVLKADPASLQLFLFLVMLFLYSTVMKKAGEGKHTLTGLIIFSILSGVCYAYQGEFLVFVILGFLTLFSLNWENRTKKIVNMICALFVPVLTAFGLLVLEISLKGADFYRYIQQFFIDRYSLTAIKPNIELPMDFSGIYMLVLISSCCFFIFAFYWEKEEKGHLFVIPWLFILGCILIFKTSQFSDRELLGTVLMILLASCGVQQFITASKPKEEKMNISDEGDSVKEPEEVPKIELIENPLPLPKKHEKKEMTYAFEPEKEQMHYDVELDEKNEKYDVE